MIRSAGYFNQAKNVLVGLDGIIGYSGGVVQTSPTIQHILCVQLFVINKGKCAVEHFPKQQGPGLPIDQIVHAGSTVIMAYKRVINV